MKFLCVAIEPHRVQVRDPNQRFVLAHAKSWWARAVAARIIALPLRAQIINEGATSTLSNVTNTITGDVTVGTNGSFTLLRQISADRFGQRTKL